MFLKRVYRYNKWLFTGILFFIAMQLFVFYKQGMVFSPWFNYGMYSGIIKPQKEYSVYKVYADGKLMKGSDYTPQQWDAIQFALTQADATACNEHFYVTQISRLYSKFHLPVPAKKNYINTLFDPLQIRSMLATHIAKRFYANTISIVPARYLWNGTQLIETDSVVNLQSHSSQCN